MSSYKIGGLKIIHGVTEAWNETGTEGNRWSVHDGDLDYYNGLYPLDDGDYLTVYAKDGSILFEDIINKKSVYGFGGNVSSPLTGEEVYWPPAALLGSWTQEGWEEREWADLFYNKLKAKLIRKEQ